MMVLRVLGAAMLVAVTGLGPALRTGSETSTVDAAPAVACLPASTTVIPQRPWAQEWLRPQRIWPLTQGAGVVVAVLDSGVDATGAQLAGRVGPGRDLLTPAGGRADNDCVGHGTFAAGIIAAAAAPGVGFVGIAPQARILPLRVTEKPAEATPAGALAAGIRIAADSGAQVIVVSTPFVRAGADLAAAVRAAAARDALIVVVASKPADGDPPVDPQLADGVLSVGGFGADGDTLSDTGAPVDLLAPGADLISVGPRGNGHLAAGGSGYAASFVAGIAALVRAAQPGLTAAQVKHRLIETADRVARPLPDPALGWGAVDLFAAVTVILPEEGAGWRKKPVPGVRAQISRPVPNGSATITLAGWAAGIGAATTLGILTVAVLVPRARRRGWRAASR